MTPLTWRAPRWWMRATMILTLPLLLAACDVDLYSGLSEQEANEILATLQRENISAKRVVAQDGSNTVRVEEDRLADAVDILRARGFPKKRYATMADVFQGNGFIQSQTEERARFIFALSEELSHTISDIDGVISARVHVVLPRSDPMRDNWTPSSASVFIRHDAAAPLDGLLPQIKLLIANSIEGLSYEKVAVIFVPVTREAPAGVGLDAAAAGEGRPAVSGEAPVGGSTPAAASADTAQANWASAATPARVSGYAAGLTGRMLHEGWLVVALAFAGTLLSGTALGVALARWRRTEP